MGHLTHVDMHFGEYSTNKTKTISLIKKVGHNQWQTL